MILFDEHTFQLGLKPPTSRGLEDDFSFSKQVIFRFQPLVFGVYLWVKDMYSSVFQVNMSQVLKSEKLILKHWKWTLIKPDILFQDGDSDMKSLKSVKIPDPCNVLSTFQDFVPFAVWMDPSPCDNWWKEPRSRAVEWPATSTADGSQWGHWECWHLGGEGGGCGMGCRCTQTYFDEWLLGYHTNTVKPILPISLRISCHHQTERNPTSQPVAS